MATEAAAAAAVALLLHRHLLASSAFGATMRLLGCSRQSVSQSPFLSAWSATLEEERKKHYGDSFRRSGRLFSSLKGKQWQQQLLPMMTIAITSMANDGVLKRAHLPEW